MTAASETMTDAPRLLDSIRLVRSVISSAGYGVPAVALQDRTLADWVGAQGVTVTVDEDDELDVLHYAGIRPTQVVFRCGAVTDSIRRAVNLGVTRFIVSTSRQIGGLTDCAQRTKFIYLDPSAPLVLGDRRLRVIGLHTDVDDSGGVLEWASAAERLLCRAALLKTCGSPIARFVLSGGSNVTGIECDAVRLASIAHTVDDALHDGCQRWQVARPAVTLAPSTWQSPPALPGEAEARTTAAA